MGGGVGGGIVEWRSTYPMAVRDRGGRGGGAEADRPIEGEQLLERPGDVRSVPFGQRWAVATAGLGPRPLGPLVRRRQPPGPGRRSRCHLWRPTRSPGTVRFLPSAAGRVGSPWFRPAPRSWSPFSRWAGLSGGDYLPGLAIGLLMMFDPAAGIAGNAISKLGSASVSSLV
ncbi:uncharacterized protein LOC144338536 [Macaca mulatta]